jgi:hypothetical protein
MQSKLLLRLIQNHQLMSHLPFCQICLLSHDTVIFHNIEAISLIQFVLLSFSWTILFPWSFNTTIHNLALIWTLCGISSSLSSCWTCIHFSFHDPQVYAINSISYSTFNELVRPLMVLSFNSPKPTKGLDALTIVFVIHLDINYF